MTSPAISIIIPTYNREMLITKALDSIFAQTFSDYEILIVDDASTDRTKDIIDQINSSKIKYFRLEKNSGQCIARNYGIKRAAGKYIAFLDSDDEWLPEKLSSQMECFERGSSELGAVYGYLYQKYVTFNKMSLVEGNYFRGNIHDKFLEGFCPPTPSLFLVKKDALESVNYFDEHLLTFVDLDLWIRVSEKYSFDYVEKPVIIKYEQIGEQYVNNFVKRYKGFKLFMNKWQNEILTKKGRKGLAKLKRRLISAIVTPILNDPPKDIKPHAGKILQLLFTARSKRWTLYLKSFLIMLFGPEFVLKLRRPS
jgi:glycosyltransferase involved in cell wall biosynthesis